MKKNYLPGKHFLQLPGPSNIPDRILRAMDYPTIDHRGPEFSKLALECFDGIKKVFKTKNDVVIYPSSGTGAWEAALVNCINENDLVLMVTHLVVIREITGISAPSGGLVLYNTKSGASHQIDFSHQKFIKN